MAKLVRVDRVGAVARVILNRPLSRNALSREMCAELLDAFTEVDSRAGDGEIRCITLEGDGAAFCAGADLKERASMTVDDMAAHSQLIAMCADRIASLQCPSIALMHGAVLGGGFELALACDLRLADPKSFLGFPEITFGFFPGAGGPVRLSRLVGFSVANYLLITGKRISGVEAESFHIVHELIEKPHLEAAGLLLAQKVASLPVPGMVALRKLMGLIDHQEVSRGMVEARRLRDELNTCPEVQGALRAFSGDHQSDSALKN
jgi:enoyl-CoA hydratase/carnithine racemase